MAANEIRRPRGRVLLWIGLALGWLLLAQAGASVLAARGVLRAADGLRAAASSIESLAAPDAQQVGDVADALSHAQNALRWLRLTSWWAPGLARMEALPRAHALGVLLTDGVSALEDLAELGWWSLLNVESGLPGAWGTLAETSVAASAVGSLGRERDRLLLVRERLVRVEGALATVPGANLARLAGLVSQGRLAVDLGLVIPQLAGGAPRTVLLVFQNDDELRATGGFVSSVAELTLENGGLTDLAFMDSYAVEAHEAAHPPAPRPLARWMDAGILLFRDANWSADFCESAQVMAALYSMDMGRQVDLVVAVNASLAARLLAALGPIWLEGYDLEVTSANVHEVAATFWAQPLESPGIEAQGAAWGEWLAHRKDIGAALVRALVERLGTLDTADLPGLATVLEEAIARKDLLVWAPADRGLQGDVTRAGWDGAVRPSSGDYVMVVESNVGWNKVNRRVSRTVAYRVELDGRIARAELTVTFENASPAGIPCQHEARYGGSYVEMTEGCYWNYVRVLVPLGSELEQVDGLDGEIEITREAGKLAFGGLALIPAGQTRAVRWVYRLPPEVVRVDEDGRYRYDLVVQKQPGVKALDLLVWVYADHAVVGDDGNWFVQRDGSVATQRTLDRDTELSVTWKP